MDIFCCRISNSITSLLVICLILMAVGPSQSEKIKDCVKKIHEVFRVFTATNNYENDLTKLFKYAILNLRYVKPEEKQGYILYTQNYGSNSQEGSKLRLLYDGNRLQGDVCNNELAYAYYKTLANIYEKGRTVLSGTTYCDGLPDAEKIPCKNALEHFGFTAEDEESIIKFAFTKIVLYDIRSNVTFIDNPTMLATYFNDSHSQITDKINSLTSKPECYLPKKYNHSCSFENIKDNTIQTLLVSLGHSMCKISADVQKLKSNVMYVKKELESFIHDDSKKGNHDAQTTETKSENLLSIFPLKTEDELLTIEKKLKNEEICYTDKLISAFVFASEGKTPEKVTTSLLKIIFTRELASKYSWKGQKGKMKLEDFHIFKVIIAAVRKKFANVCKNDVRPSIMTWFAQASQKVKARQLVDHNVEEVDEDQSNSL